MSPAPRIAQVDATAEKPAGAALAQGVDLQALEAEISDNPNRSGRHPFRVYWESVLSEAGVPDSTETREMASNICSAVARLPFVPEKEEFDRQVEKTAKRAEDAMDSDMVWTSAAQKIARVALEIRRDEPARAWIQDPLPADRKVA